MCLRAWLSDIICPVFFFSTAQMLVSLQFLPSRSRCLNHHIPSSSFYFMHILICINKIYCLPKISINSNLPWNQTRSSYKSENMVTTYFNYWKVDLSGFCSFYLNYYKISNNNSSVTLLKLLLLILLSYIVSFNEIVSICYIKELNYSVLCLSLIHI